MSTSLFYLSKDTPPEFYFYKISEAELIFLAEALNTCQNHTYSDGQVHHQTFDTDLITRAQQVLAKFNRDHKSTTP